MAFTVPTFNLTCNVYTGPWNTRVLRVPGLSCNLAWGRRVSKSDADNDFNEYSAIMTLLVPAGSDVRDSKCGYVRDSVECPAGSGRIYFVASVDDIGKGFPNEHRGVLLAAASEAIYGISSEFAGLFWPTPIP